MISLSPLPPEACNELPPPHCTLHWDAPTLNNSSEAHFGDDVLGVGTTREEILKIPRCDVTHEVIR